MSKGKLLVVDDDEDIKQLIEASLVNHGFEVVTAGNGADGVSRALAENPDLIVMDVEMPGMDGITACREIRRYLATPVLFLSVRSDSADKVEGLKAGGDNYVTKPFEVSELLAFIDAAVRRQHIYSEAHKHQDVIHLKDLAVNISAHDVQKAGVSIPLTSTEFKLLRALAQNRGRVVTREQLLDQVWEVSTSGVYSRTIDVHIGRIRRKIGDNPLRPRYIVTVSGVGYKMLETP